MTIEPKVLAETLFTELIQKKHCDIPENVCVPSAAFPVIEAKIRLYQFTSILLAIMSETSRRPEFNLVQEHLERLYFPPTLEQGIYHLWDVQTAMKNLSELLTRQEEKRTIPSSEAGKSMSWARNWLASVGVDETNPVTLHLLGLKWLDYYIMVAESLKEFDLVA